MQVVHVVESFGGGVIGFVAQLVVSLPRHNHIVVHAIRSGEVDPEITKARFPATTQFIIWPHAVREVGLVSDTKALLSLVQILRRLRNPHTVVHLHSSKAGFLGRIAAQLVGIKAVAYTPNAAAFLRQDISDSKKRVFALLERLGFIFRGRVVACSPSEAAALAKVGVRSLTIANGTEINPLSRLHPEDGTHFVTFINTGRTTPQKDPAFFNQVALALAHRPSVRFLWVGTGELDHLLTSPNITITGWLAKAEIQQLLGQSQIYLSTSTWEGLSFAILEAMERGLPLLLRRCVGNVDQVVDGKNGYGFSKLSEAVERANQMADSPTQLDVMGQESRKRLEDLFSLHACSTAYNHLYKALLSA